MQVAHMKHQLLGSRNKLLQRTVAVFISSILTYVMIDVKFGDKQNFSLADIFCKFRGKMSNPFSKCNHSTAFR